MHIINYYDTDNPDAKKISVSKAFEEMLITNFIFHMQFCISVYCYISLTVIIRLVSYVALSTSYGMNFVKMLCDQCIEL